MPFTHEFAAKCFVDPPIKDGSELSDVLFEFKDPKEREKPAQAADVAR